MKILVMVYLCCPRDIIKSGNYMRVLDMYYASGNYEAFARPRKPEGVESKSAYIIGGIDSRMLSGSGRLDER